MSSATPSPAVEIAKEEATKALVYKVPPHQLADAYRRGLNRRRVRVFRDAEITRRRAKNAARRLEASLRHSDTMPDRSLIGLCQKLKRIGETKVVGKDWRKPRPGRRL